ncbi:hypothetical protein WJX74_005054, partial [Apatococcus lobatus]
MADDQIITLNVGGKEFSTSRQTLQKEQSMLASLTDTELNSTRDAQGRIFIDRDPRWFHLILNYLRDGRCVMPTDEAALREILYEADFYQLEGLKGFILPDGGWRPHYAAQLRAQLPEAVQGNQKLMKEALDLILKCAFGSGPRAPTRSTAHVSLAVHDYAEPGGSPLPGQDVTFFRAVHQSAICKGPGDSLWFQESFPLRCSMRGSNFVYSFRPSHSGIHSLGRDAEESAMVAHEEDQGSPGPQTVEGADVASLHRACCKQGLGQEEAWLRNIILLVLHNQEALRLALRLCDFRAADVVVHSGLEQPGHEIGAEAGGILQVVKLGFCKLSKAFKREPLTEHSTSEEVTLDMALMQRVSRSLLAVSRAEQPAFVTHSSPLSICTSSCSQADADSSDKESSDNRQNFQKEVPPMSPVGQNMEVPTDADPSERAEWVPPQVPQHKSGKRFPDSLETDDTFPNEERRGIKPPPDPLPKEVVEGDEKGPTTPRLHRLVLHQQRHPGASAPSALPASTFKVPLLPQRRKQRHASAPSDAAVPEGMTSQGLMSDHHRSRASIPKAPPNDPERRGNIWQRYEELENATQRLDMSNRQLAAEKSRSAAEKGRLEQQLADLRQQNSDLHQQIAQGSQQDAHACSWHSQQDPALLESLQAENVQLSNECHNHQQAISKLQLEAHALKQQLQQDWEAGEARRQELLGQMHAETATAAAKIDELEAERVQAQAAAQESMQAHENALSALEASEEHIASLHARVAEERRKAAAAQVETPQDQSQQLSPRAAGHPEQAGIIADLEQANQSLRDQLQQRSNAAAAHRQEPGLIAALERANQSLELHCQANNSLIDELKVHNQRLEDELAHAQHQPHGEDVQPDMHHNELSRQLQLRNDELSGQINTFRDELHRLEQQLAATEEHQPAATIPVAGQPFVSPPSANIDMQEMLDENAELKQALQSVKDDLHNATRQSAGSQLAADFRDLAEHGPRDAPALQAEMRRMVEQHRELQAVRQGADSCSLHGFEELARHSGLDAEALRIATWQLTDQLHSRMPDDGKPAPAVFTIQPPQPASDEPHSDCHCWLQQHCKDLRSENDALQRDIAQLDARSTTYRLSTPDPSGSPELQKQHWQAERAEFEQTQRQLQTELRRMAALADSQAADHEADAAELLDRLRQLQEQNAQLQATHKRRSGSIEGKEVVILQMNGHHHASAPARNGEYYMQEGSYLGSADTRSRSQQSEISSAEDQAFIDQLQEENHRLKAEVASLHLSAGVRDQSSDLLESNSSSRTSSPTREGASLQAQNRRLMEANSRLSRELSAKAQLRAGQSESEAVKALELLVDDLKAQLQKALDEEAVNKGHRLRRNTSLQTTADDENLALIGHLTELNVRLEADVSKLAQQLAAAHPEDGTSSIAELVNDMSANSTRLSSEKQMVMELNSRLAEKNSRLHEENDILQQRLGGSQEPARTKSSGLLGGIRSLGRRNSRSKQLPPAPTSLPMIHHNNLYGSQQQEQLWQHSSPQHGQSMPSTPCPSTPDTAERPTAGHATGRSSPDVTASLQQPDSILNTTASSHMPDDTSLHSTVRDLSDENSRLAQEMDRLLAEIDQAREMAEDYRRISDQHHKLEEENQKLRSGVVLVQELSEENAKLAEENRQIHVSIRKVLEDNAELTNRLIEIALRNEEGGDGIFGSDGRSPNAAGGAAPGIMSTSQDDMRKRRNELAEQMQRQEERQHEDASRRANLLARSSVQVEMLRKLGGDQQSEEPAESRQPERPQANGNSPAHAQDPTLIMKQIKRMSREGRREARLSGSHTLSTAGSTTQGHDPVDDGMSPTSQQHQDAAVRDFEEAVQRRQEAEQARQELQAKIEASQRKAQAESLKRQGSASYRELEPDRRTQEQQQLEFNEQKKRSEMQVRRVYARHVGASDISGFMSDLGYSGFDQLSGPASTAFRLAFSITNPDRCMQQPLAQRALAEAAYKQLQEWSAQLDSDPGTPEQAHHKLLFMQCILARCARLLGSRIGAGSTICLARFRLHGMEDVNGWEDSPTTSAVEEEGDFFQLTAGELPLEDEEEEDDVDPYYFIVPQQTPKGNIYQASRVGDVERIRFLVETEHVDVNTRDLWDSVPLYYACLTGRLEVVQYLLEAGAVCNEYTFDGDRCHYASLNEPIRVVLRQYEARAPPLGPLASDLRCLSSLCADPEAQVQPSVSDGETGEMWCDFAFVIQGERIPLHRAILAARSPFLRRRLHNRWLPREGDGRREVWLANERLQPATLKAVLAFLYTERLDIAMADVAAVKEVAAKCKLAALQASIDAELRTLKYYFKTTRREEAPRRFVLQPGSVKGEARLAADLSQLRDHCAALETHSLAVPARDFADLLLQVEGRRFRAHRCILAARSEYFRALFQRSTQSTQHSQAASFGTPPDTASPAASLVQQQQQYSPAKSQYMSNGLAEDMGDLRLGSNEIDSSISGSTQHQQQQFGSMRLHPEQISEDNQELKGSSIGMNSQSQQSLPMHQEGQRRERLPCIQVDDVAADVFEVLLRFIYTDSVGELDANWAWAAETQRLLDAAERYLMLSMKRAVSEAIISVVDRRGCGEVGKLESLCRLLLVADTYSARLLRKYCLHRLGAWFDLLASPGGPQHERAVFQAFLLAVAPQDSKDLLDGSGIVGASHGNIEGGGVGGE